MLTQSMSNTHNLFNLQKNAIKHILNLHQNVENEDGKPVWKILIYDTFGQNIISPLFTIAELRECGVTLHLLINSQREPIPESTAVYFMQPSETNLSQLYDDFYDQKYSKYYLSFITPISRILLETLAIKSIEYKSSEKIIQICDEYLNYISLHNNIFISTTDPKNHISFQNFNSARMTEAEINQSVSEVVDSLFSMISTNSQMPVIKCIIGGPSELIAKELNRKLRDHLVETKGAGFSRFAASRPLLLIVDRTIDLSAPLLHSWGYLSLIDDLFTVKLNQISYESENSVKTYDLNIHDTFFQTHKFKSFPEVAENIQIEVENYKNSEFAVKNMNMNPDTEIIEDIWSPHTPSLANAIDSLPDLMRRKKFIDMHTNIASAIMDRIKSCKLDSLFEIEQKLIVRSVKDTNEIVQLLNDVHIRESDKIRLLLLCCLHDYLPQNMVTEFKSNMSPQNQSSVEYLQKFKNYRKMATVHPTPSSVSSSYTSVLSKIVSKTPNALLEGIKNLVVGQNYLPLTRMVKSCLDARVASDYPDMMTFDPCSHQSQGMVSDLIVYVVGGGCYNEYQNVVSLLNNKQYAGVKLMYGCTEMVSPNGFTQKLGDTQ